MSNAMPFPTATNLVAEAELNPHAEVCGFITYDWTIVPIRNVALRPARAFEMDEDELLALMRRTNGRLLGIYHTHPGGSPMPSDTDETFCYANYYRYFIVTATGVYEWTFTNDGPRSVGLIGETYPANVAYPLFSTAKVVRRTG